MRVAIVVSGLPGSGKTIATSVLESLGFRVVRMGDVVRKLATSLGISTDRASVEARLRYGMRIVAYEVIKSAEPIDGIVVIDGVRSLEEVEAIEEVFDKVLVLYVVASREDRFRRLSARGREDDPKTWSDFLAREYRELKFGVANVISRADYILVNDGTVEEFSRRVKNIALDILTRYGGRSSSRD